MAVSIKLDQAGNVTVGTPGFAREDFVLGTPVTVAAIGGPFLQQQWSFLDRPVDLSIPAQSAAAFVDPTAATTTVTPISIDGTYFIQVVVDSGLGLGATADDIAQLTFYAGPTLSAVWNALPRRVMAFLERNQHNPKGDPIFGVAGNKRGWAQEMARWFGLIKDHSVTTPKAFARIALTGGGAVVTMGRNLTALRTGAGLVKLSFITPMPNGNYVVLSSPRGAKGQTFASAEATTDFVIEREDSAGAVTDADFNVAVLSL